MCSSMLKYPGCKSSIMEIIVPVPAFNAHTYLGTLIPELMHVAYLAKSDNRREAAAYLGRYCQLNMAIWAAESHCMRRSKGLVEISGGSRV